MLLDVPHACQESAGAAASDASCAPNGCPGMPGLSVVAARHADRVRRRQPASRSHADWRATGKRRRPCGPSVCRTRGQTSGEGAHRGGYRSRSDLPHERREALQVGASRKTAHPRQAQRGRNRRLPPVARVGNFDPASPRDRVSRRDGRQNIAGAFLQGDQRPRAIHPVRACAARHGHGSSIFHPAGARSGRSAGGDAGVCLGFEETRREN